MKDRRMFLRIFFIATAFAVMSFIGMVNRPTWANIRGVDVVHLIGTGMCLGVAFVFFGNILSQRAFSLTAKRTEPVTHPEDKVSRAIMDSQLFAQPIKYADLGLSMILV